MVTSVRTRTTNFEIQSGWTVEAVIETLSCGPMSGTRTTNFEIQSEWICGGLVLWLLLLLVLLLLLRASDHSEASTERVKLRSPAQREVLPMCRAAAVAAAGKVPCCCF